jgi:hypothetical protein
MTSPSPLDLFLAEWVLERSSPEDAVRRAVGALEAGCINPAVAIVAGTLTAHPTRSEIEPQLARLLHDFGGRLPSLEHALKLLVDDCVRRILDGRTDPIRAAWELLSFTANEDESPEFYGQVRRFVDLATEDNKPGDAILTEARAFLDRGGLQPPRPAHG